MEFVDPSVPKTRWYTYSIQKIREGLTAHKTLVIGIAAGVGVLLFIALNIFLFQYGSRIGRQSREAIVPSSTPTITPTPIPFSTKGKMEFSVSTTGGAGPRFTQCSIDPLDFSAAPTQVFRVSMESDTPVTDARVWWQTDHKKTEVPLRLVSGTAAKGEWEGVYTVSDTSWYTYVLTMEATNATQTNSVVLSLR